jgi:YidC/Oxa1 family membrane protein insertase
MEAIVMPILDFFYQMTGNYGLAIILLTVAVKLAFWNLTNKQYESMAAMRKIQPKMKELQKQHKDNPQKMNQEMMVLYKEHGVNPFGGCLPMLIQLPVMIALFSTLNSKLFHNIAAGKSFLWISNISFAETAKLAGGGWNSLLVMGSTVLPVLAILVSVTTWLTQKTMDMDPDQQAMMAFMPVLLLFISYNLNAGVLLYWVVSNGLTAFQQVYVKKHNMIKEEVAVIEVKPIKPKKK